MKWGLWLGVVLLTCGILCWGVKILDIPEYDGKDRVHQLTNKNYRDVMKKYDVMVIYYHKTVGENRMAKKQFEVEELALEVCLKATLYLVESKESNKRIKHIGDWYLIKNKYPGLTRLALKGKKASCFSKK